jgi:hypothetical protein
MRAQPTTPPPAWPAVEQAAIDDVESVPDGLQCAVCWELLYDPVLWPLEDSAKDSCRHAFCKQCTRACISRHEARCPLCRTPAADDAQWCELTVDPPTLRRLEVEVPELHGARLAAERREVCLRQSLQSLMMYTMDQRYRFKAGQTVTFYAKEAQHLWLVVKLMVSGTRRVGVCFGDERVGGTGRIATVMNLPFFRQGLPSVKSALGKVLFEITAKVRSPPVVIDTARVSHAQESRVPSAAPHPH